MVGGGSESLYNRAMSAELFDTQAARPAPEAAPYLETLNAAQRQRVEARDGPGHARAGATTGKRGGRAARRAQSLVTRRRRAAQRLAVTCTTQCARETRERLSGMIGGAG